MEPQNRHLPPLFQEIPGAHSDTVPPEERNVLEEVPGHLLSPQRQTYEVSEELRLLIIWMSVLLSG